MFDGMKSNYWYLAAICILLLLWLQAERESWRLDSEMDGVYLNEVTVQAVDADTRQPLPIVLRGPSKGAGQRWPKHVGVTATGDLSEMRVRWIDIGPAEVGVAAEGYQEQRLQLDRQTEGRIVVPLRR